MAQVLEQLDANPTPGTVDVLRAIVASNVTLPRWSPRATAPRSDIGRLYYHITGMSFGGNRVDWDRARRRLRIVRPRAPAADAPRFNAEEGDDGGDDGTRPDGLEDDVLGGDRVEGCEDCDEGPDAQYVQPPGAARVPSYTVLSVPGVAPPGCLVPIAPGVPFWNSHYVHGGTSIAPFGVRIEQTRSWFLCPLLADACGLGFLYPTEVVPRPAGAMWASVMRRLHLGVDVTFSWQRVVELLRAAMRISGLDDAAMLARMDFQAHWPGTLQERVVSAVGQLVPPLDVTHAEYIVLHELPDMMSLLLAEVSVVYAHDIQGRHYYQSAYRAVAW